MFGFLRRNKTTAPDKAPLAEIDPLGSASTVTSPPSSAPTLAPPTPERAGWMAKLRGGLSKTRSGLTGLFSRTKIDDQLLEELEDALLMSDAGVDATRELLSELREQVRINRIEDSEQVRTILKSLIKKLLTPFEAPLDIDRVTPLVMMIAGVNGAGKTTSIGKLTRHLQGQGKSILLAAGDTFRAAARKSLRKKEAILPQSRSMRLAPALRAILAWCSSIPPDVFPPKPT
jgi:fused signal recognition particle receptor